MFSCVSSLVVYTVDVRLSYKVYGYTWNNLVPNQFDVINNHTIPYVQSRQTPGQTQCTVVERSIHVAKGSTIHGGDVEGQLWRGLEEGIC